MMLSEAAHRFAPQFVIPLLQYGFCLIEACKTAVVEVIGCVFQTLIFPIVELCYNTVVSFNIFQFVGSVSNGECQEEVSTKTGRVRMGRMGDSQMGYMQDNSNASAKYARRNQYMRDDYCGSSFDGSNSSASDETSQTTDSPNKMRNVRQANIDETEMDDALPQVPTRAGPSLYNDNDSNNDEDDGIDDTSNGYYSNQFAQQIMGTVSDYASQAKQIRTDIHDKWEVSVNGLKNQIEKNTPKNLTKNVNEMCDESKNKAMSSFNYYKEEWLLYYFGMIVNVIENPTGIVDSLKNYVNQKQELVMEWYNFGKDWVDYGIFLAQDLFDTFWKTVHEMKNGTFNYWQAVWNMSHFVQQLLIRMLKYLGGRNWIARIIIFCDILGKLQAVKTYSKGPEIVHQRHY